MGKEISLFHKIRDHLFTAAASLNGNVMQYDNFSEKELEIKKRWEAGFTHWLDDYNLTQKDIALFLVDTFNISYPQALLDVNNIKLLLGNVKNAGKEWHRYVFIERVNYNYTLAKEAKDLNAMNAATAIYAKYTKLDKDEADGLNYDEIIPPEWEPVNDVKVLGLKPLDNIDERKEKFLKKYYSNQEITDADIIENVKR